MNACPHCKSTNGYQYARQCRDYIVGTWDGFSESDELVYSSGIPDTVVCLDCGARVPNPEKMEKNNDR